MAEVVLSHISKRFLASDGGCDAGFTLGPIDLAFPDG